LRRLDRWRLACECRTRRTLAFLGANIWPRRATFTLRRVPSHTATERPVCRSIFASELARGFSTSATAATHPLCRLLYLRLADSDVGNSPNASLFSTNAHSTLWGPRPHRLLLCVAVTKWFNPGVSPSCIGESRPRNRRAGLARLDGYRRPAGRAVAHIMRKRQAWSYWTVRSSPAPRCDGA
jgi:hypothetical protein